MKFCSEGEPFFLQINSIEEFVIFCRIIRGNEVDDAKLLELTAQLRKNVTTVLDEAVRDDAGQP